MLCLQSLSVLWNLDTKWGLTTMSVMYEWVVVSDTGVSNTSLSSLKHACHVAWSHWFPFATSNFPQLSDKTSISSLHSAWLLHPSARHLKAFFFRFFTPLTIPLLFPVFALLFAVCLSQSYSSQQCQYDLNSDSFHVSTSYSPSFLRFLCHVRMERRGRNMHSCLIPDEILEISSCS